MNELDQFWSIELAKKIDNARRSGRADVADYLELRAKNDSVRVIGTNWLTQSLVAIAVEAERGRMPINIVREEPHRFTMLKATMAGTLLKFQYGVRCLTLEAGWTRTPNDGFMRGGALAAARLSHLGIPAALTELVLIMKAETPTWHELREERPGGEFGLTSLQNHIDLLIQ